MIKLVYKGVLLEFDAPPSQEDVLKKYEEVSNKGLATSWLSSLASDNKYPLTFMQQAMWFNYQLDKDTAFNTIQFSINLVGELNVTALKKAIVLVASRHTAFKTVIHSENGYPYQKYNDEIEPEIQEFDFSLSHNKDEMVNTLSKEQANRRFNLEKDSLMRTYIVKLGERKHCALVCMHHIISDGTSITIFIDDLLVYYKSIVYGRNAILNQLSVDHCQFALDQHRMVNGSDFEYLRTFWKKKLNGEMPILNLPTNNSTSSRVFSGDTIVETLDFLLVEKLKGVSKKNNVTLFMILLATYSVLLSRISGLDDVIITVPVTYRNNKELQGVIGCFINTVPIRCQLWGNPTFSDFLQRVRATVLDAYQHKDFPFSKIIELVNPNRSENIFPVMLSYQSSPLVDQDLPNLHFSVQDLPEVSNDQGIVLDILEKENEVKLRWQYRSDLFDKATIQSLMSQFTQLIHSIIHNPFARINQLEILPHEDKEKILSIWNDTFHDFGEFLPFHVMFENQVLKTPDQAAILFKNDVLSYRELNCKANKLANYLRKMEVGPETIVCVYMETSFELAISILAILKTGGTYIPLDPFYPQDRLAYMLEDSDSRLVVTQANLREKLDWYGRKVICVDLEWDEIDVEPNNNLRSELYSDNLAYIMYTSGSTGRPKGTMITHRGLTNYLSWAIQSYPFKEGQGVPVHSSISFDLTITSLLAPLLVGQKVILLPQEGGIENLINFLKQNKDLTLIKLTPTHLRILSNSLAPSHMKGLAKAIVVGGEALYLEDVSLWRKNCPDMQMFNEYGPTETVVGCCVYSVPANFRNSNTIPIGRPIANTKIYILDSEMKLVPIGVIGEIYIAGNGVGRGYLNQMQLTKERFIDNPFDSKGVLYKTGDLGRLLSNGEIEYIGRTDQQVKIYGYRIELGEIEAVLSEHEAVKQCCVVTYNDISNEKYLVAYVMVDLRAIRSNFSDKQVSSVLKDFLAKKIPTFMIPRAFVEMDTLPLTPAGKIDRTQLSKLPFQPNNEENKYVPPSSEIEKMLVDIWEKVFGIHPIGIYDNFFELGGHSLLATQLISRIEQVMHIDIPLKYLFEKPTIADSAKFFEFVAELVSEIEQTSEVNSID